MTFRMLPIRAAQRFWNEAYMQHSYITAYCIIDHSCQLPENKLRQEPLLFISLLKARIGAQMEGGGGTRVIGMTLSKGSIWSISGWMNQVASVSCSSDGNKKEQEK